MYNILFKIATRERSKLFDKHLNIYFDNISEQNNFNILVSLDEDDPELEKYLLTIKKYKNVFFVVGKSTNKINSLNRDINEFDYNWNILMVLCDHTYPSCKNFDNIIRQDFEKYFSDLDGIIYHSPRNCKGYEICHYPEIGINFYKRFNRVFYEGYISGYADSELADCARSFNKYVRVKKTITSDTKETKRDKTNLKWLDQSKDKITYEQRSGKLWRINNL